MFTLATPFTNKPQVIPIWLESLRRLEIPRQDFKLVWVDMTDNPEIHRLLESYLQAHGHEWKEVVYLQNPPKKFPVIIDHDYSSQEAAAARNNAISETMNLINFHREGHLLLWEDDIVVPPSAWERVKFVFDSDDCIAGVTGVQYHRGVGHYCEPLVWHFYPYRKKVANEPRSVSDYLVIQLPKDKEKEVGTQSIDCSATGFILLRDSFLENYTFCWSHFPRGYSAGHDIMLGFHINEYDKKNEPGPKKLMLCWDLKFPHLGLGEDSKLRVFKSELCKTEIPGSALPS